MLHECLPRGKRRICINMDETSVKLRPPPSRGLLVAGARERLRGRASLSASGTKGELRCNLTQLVFICDDDDVQQALPTILLISKKAFSDATFHRMQASLPPHIHLWRQPRAWVTGKTMAAACRLLASALEPWRPHAEVIFSADTYRGHLTQGVWRAMARNRFAYLLIPAKLTWGLQPCDTHVFAGYKRQLLEEQQLWRITQAASSPSGGAGMSPPPASAPQSQVMCLLHSLIAAYEKSIRRRSWTAAFASNGLGHRLADISTSVLQQLQFDHVPHGLDRWPTYTDFEHIFPAKTDIPVDAIFSFCTWPAAGGHAHPHRGRLPIDVHIARPITRSASGSVAGVPDPPPERLPCPPAAAVPKAGMMRSRVPTAKRLGPPPR